MVDDQGFEPRAPESTDLQSAAVANAAHHPNFKLCKQDLVTVWCYGETY